jgi:hypothetical protein
VTVIPPFLATWSQIGSLRDQRSSEPKPEQKEDFGRVLDGLVLLTLLSSGLQGVRTLGSEMGSGALDGKLSDVVAFSCYLLERTDLGPRLRMLLAATGAEKSESFGGGCAR